MLIIIILLLTVLPGRYIYIDATGNHIMSVNGSSEDGNCNLVGTRICNEPTTSVLQDGIIPTLTGLDGDMWASQLLTLSSSTNITFDFQATRGYVGVERVEVVMFNCPEWGISVDSITLNESTTTTATNLATVSPNITSCDSLVRVCISGPVNLELLTLRFQLSSASTWVHLAEVTFYEANPTCPPKNIRNTTSAPITSESDTSTEASTTNNTATESLLTSSLIVVSSVLFFIVLILTTIIIILSLLLRYYKKYQHTSKTDTPPNHDSNVKHKSDGTDSTIEGEKQILYEQLQICGGDRGVATEGVTDPQYMEIETRRGNTFVLRGNEAYATWK